MTQESVEEHGWAIGIDFGTVNTRVAVFRNDRLEIIPDEDGNPSMASIVSFNDTSRLIGSRARSQLAFNPRNTIFNVKRLVGRRLNDPEVTADIHNFPFKVDELGRELAVVVEFKGETCKFAVMEIAAMILGKAKDNAEHYLGAPVTGAVVSVPAYWGTERRNAIFDAGRLSGLNILHLMPAPCASALAWEYYAKVRGNGKENICNILIYDLGGGTLNAALATIEVGVIELKAIAGDTELGGEDFLQRLVEDKVSEIKKSWGRNITSNRRSLQRLRTACERAITDLSSANSVHINVDSLFEGRDFHSLITRNRFRVLCQELTRDILRPIDRVLDDAKHDKSRLDEVLLVGGSSRIPQIRQILRDHLGVTPTKSISQDEAEVAGLAIWASMLSGALDPTTSELLILEVTPFSIGIDGGGGVFEEILPRNSTTPAARSRIFLMEPGTGYLYVYEGERVRAKNNTLLAKVDLSSSGLFASDSPPPADSKDPRFLLECTVDVPSRTQHAKLTVLNRLTGWSVTTPLHVVGTLDHETFVQRKERTLRLKEEDDMEAERFRALDTLEGRIASLIEFLHLTPSPASETAVAWAERVRDWVEGNQYASTEEYKEKEQVLDDIEKIFTFQKFEKARLESLKITVEDDLTVTPGHPAPPGRSSRDFESKLARQQDITKSLERIRSVLAAASLSSPTTREGKPREVEAQPARSPADIATAPPFSDDTPTVRPKAAQPSVDEEPPSEKSTTASEASAIQQARPPQHDSDSLGDLFARARGPAPEPFTDAQFERVSNFLRSTGNAAWAHVPRLYTVLRLIGQVDTMGFFLAQGINDIWFPFANGTLPPAMEPSAQTNFLESQTVVLSKGFRLEGDPDRRHVNFSGNDTLPFEVVARLGRGTHGSVNKIVSTISYRQYAQKVFRKARGLRREDVKSFITELGILKRVQHKHCIELVSPRPNRSYILVTNT